MDASLMSKVKSIFNVVLLFPEIKICHVRQYTLTHHFVRRLIGFVVCCNAVNQQKQRRQRQQRHHGDFMRNQGHFLVLHELAEKRKIFKDCFNINSFDSDKQDLRRSCLLLQNYSGIYQPQNTFVQLLRRFLSFRTFEWCFSSLKKLACDIHKLPGSCFQVLLPNPIQSLYGNAAKIEYHLFYSAQITFHWQ